MRGPHPLAALNRSHTSLTLTVIVDNMQVVASFQRVRLHLRRVCLLNAHSLQTMRIPWPAGFKKYDSFINVANLNLVLPR